MSETERGYEYRHFCKMAPKGTPISEDEVGTCREEGARDERRTVERGVWKHIMTGAVLDQVLGAPMEPDDSESGAGTVGGYLGALLYTLWNEGEGFSGKRPFGDSGWEYELYKPLIKAGLVKGELDSDGYIDEVDTKAADKLIADAISHLFKDY